jgi:hypothetical protein
VLSASKYLVIAASPKPDDCKGVVFDEYLSKVELLAKATNAIFLSSVDIYRGPYACDCEESQSVINSRYTELKVESEKIVIANEGNVLRLPFIIGRHNQTGSVCKVLKGFPSRLHPSSRIQVVTDSFLLSVILSILSRGISKEIINVCPSDSVTLSDIADQYRPGYSSFGDYLYSPALMSSCKLEKILGLKKKSISEMIASFLGQETS